MWRYLFFLSQRNVKLELQLNCVHLARGGGWVGIIGISLFGFFFYPLHPFLACWETFFFFF